MSHLNKCTFRGDNEDTLHHCAPGVWVINLQLSGEEVAAGWVLRGCRLSVHRSGADSLDSAGWFCHQFSRFFFSYILSPTFSQMLVFEKGKGSCCRRDRNTSLNFWGAKALSNTEAPGSLIGLIKYLRSRNIEGTKRLNSFSDCFKTEKRKRTLTSWYI